MYHILAGVFSTISMIALLYPTEKFSKGTKLYALFVFILLTVLSYTIFKTSIR